DGISTKTTPSLIAPLRRRQSRCLRSPATPPSLRRSSPRSGAGKAGACALRRLRQVYVAHRPAPAPAKPVPALSGDSAKSTSLIVNGKSTGMAHSHDHHGHGHDHGVSAETQIRPLTIAFALIVAFMGVEIVLAVVAHSLALFSDAAHML